MKITSWCTTEIDQIIGSEIDSNGKLMQACGSPQYVWQPSEELLVTFLDSIPDDWKCAGSKMNFENIISWANQWSSSDSHVIPSFKRHIGTQSHIRIRFNGES